MRVEMGGVDPDLASTWESAFRWRGRDRGNVAGRKVWGGGDVGHEHFNVARSRVVRVDTVPYRFAEAEAAEIVAVKRVRR